MEEKLLKLEKDVADIKLYVEMSEDSNETFEEIVSRIKEYKKEATR